MSQILLPGQTGLSEGELLHKMDMWGRVLSLFEFDKQQRMKTEGV